MKKAIAATILIVLFLTLFPFSNQHKISNEKAINGSMNLDNWNFVQNGIVTLDGQWEFYNNKLLTPEDVDHEKPDRYLVIPSKLKDQLNGETTGYMTLRLKISAPGGIVYGFRIKSLLSASKVWVNGVLQGEVGKVGKSFQDEKAIYLPLYSYFASKDGIVDIVIQTSNFRDVFPSINSMEFGLKNQIMNVFLLNVSVDLIIIGSLLILELLFLSLHKRIKKDKSFLYFSILCLFIQLRCLFLNERIIVNFFPNMPYEMLSKIAALTYYLWVPVYVLFLKEQFKEFPKKVMVLSSSSSVLFTIICLTTNNTFYDRLSFLSEAILLIIILITLLFLINKVKEKGRNSQLSLLAFIILIITATNDILTNNGILHNRYIFQIGMFAFAFLETYILTVNFSYQIRKSEELKIENQFIYEKSIRDSLTNLYNRERIEEILDNMVKEYIQEGMCFTIAMLDIDYFKSVNDTYGHLYGDNVLVMISNTLKESLRSTDYIGRYGGEEFIIILPNTKKDKAKEVLEKIRHNIENLSWENGNTITISGGLYENDTHIAHECIANADKLLYLAKEKGRNRIEM